MMSNNVFVEPHVRTNRFNGNPQARLFRPNYDIRREIVYDTNGKRVRFPNPNILERFQNVRQTVEQTQQMVNNLDNMPRPRHNQVDFENQNLPDPPNNNLIVPFANNEDNSISQVDLQCVVCFDHNRSILLIPCNHMPCCIGCIDTIIGIDNKCPTCRTPIENTTKVFL